MIDQAKTFRERAYEHYKGELKELKAVEKKLEQKDATEIEEYREPLSYDQRKEMTILLAWGGPSDGYKIYLDTDGEAIEGYYFFADWFEYEEFKLSDEELDRVLAVYPVVC